MTNLKVIFVLNIFPMQPNTIYRIAVIDDEADAINVVVKMLENFSTLSFKITGTANNLEEGVELIKKTKPDLIFLDIEMPGKNGLAIYDYFEKPDFKIIFMTAYQQYAIDALKKSASDYLLKPLNIVELKDSLQKIVKQIEQKFQDEEFKDKINILSSAEVEGKNILLEVEAGFIMENTSNIEYVYAHQSYSVIVTHSKKEILVTKSLKQLHELLPKNQFYRTHKSYLINIYFIRKFTRMAESYVLLKSGVRIPVSVRTSALITKEIKEMLQN